LITAILVSCVMLSASPGDASVADRETYLTEKARAGRNPDANVRLALWCEAHGLEAERLKHLSLAALADPSHAVARALMGLVSEGGRWGRPESVADRLKADPAVAALRSEYVARRNKTGATPDDQWQLARWCEKNGLDAEAMAHDTAVTRLDPSREQAWKKLGCVKFEGRWLTPAQIVALKVHREAQRQADRYWLPIVERWKNLMESPQRQAEIEAAMLEMNDPRAVPSIWKVFAQGSSKDQVRAVRLFSQIDSTEASQRLAMIAIFGGTEKVRRQAIETLRGRDVRWTLDLFTRSLRDPIKYAAKPNFGPDSPGIIYIEGQEANLERIYQSRPVGLRVLNDRDLGLYFRQVETATYFANMRFADDLRWLESRNMTITAINENALAALKGITGKDFGLDRNAWQAWWTDRQGYAFQAQTGQTSQKITLTQFVDPYAPAHSCFAGGTPVQTIDGPRPIEDLKIGDRVLTQDTTSGVLSYQPALVVFHNPPADTLRVRISGESIVATGIHRFWKAGHGWIMARELKVGDVVRVIGGTAHVESVEPDKNQPVFNLEVSRSSDFFVGNSGALVHDNSLVRTVARPFDVVADFKATSTTK
jgi:Pretoxin HINT domain